MLNERFRGGGRSNDLAAAGVVVHQFDSLDDTDPARQPWQPGANWRALGDRISATIINARMTHDPAGNLPVYSLSNAGYVLNPFVNRMLCAHPFDVGSVNRVCGSHSYPNCVPGCTTIDGRAKQWCEPGDEDPWPCAWRPANLGSVMAAREDLRAANVKPRMKHHDDGKFYAELVFDASHFIRGLPHSMDAMFFIHGECNDIGDKFNHNAACEEYARIAHETVLRHFGLSPADLPLLRLDPFDWHQPFRDL